MKPRNGLIAAYKEEVS